MTTILVAVFLQLNAGEGAQPPAPMVMAAITAEFASPPACRNAVAGLLDLGRISGFTVNAICAPKDIAKLEVEKPKAEKPKASPPAKGMGGGTERGSSS